MKSYTMKATAEHGTIELVEAPVPEAGPQQVLVKVRAAGLNRGEFIIGHGLAKAGSVKPIGMECAGEIAGLGPGVAGLRVGQRVMGRCPGAFSEYAAMDVREAVAMPERLSFEEAAAVPVTFMVVQDILFAQGRLEAGEWVLVLGVSSGVGVAALQAAKDRGARVIGTSGSREKLDKLEALGLDVAICTRSGDFSAEVLEATGGRGANLVVNSVGGSVFAEAIRAMAFEGRYAQVGYVDNVLKAEIDLQALHARRLTLFGVSNKLRTPEQRASGVPGFVADILPGIAAGRIKPLVDRVFPFAELGAARAHMEANRHLGKIVITMPDAARGEGR
jgi:NADPH:quinone reductase-like Zn-dependent oxidoreductase